MGDLSAGGALVPPGDRADRHARRRRGGSDRPHHPRPHRAVDRPVADGSGELRVRLADRPGSRREPSSPWTPQPGSASGWWSTASPRRTSSSTPGPSPPTPTSTRSVPRTPGRRCWRSAYALLATGDAARLDEADEAASRAARGARRERGRDGCPPVRRPPTGHRPGPRSRPAGGRRRRRGDRRPARPTGRRRLHAPAVRAGRALGRRWPAVVRTTRQARQQVRALARAYVDRRVAGAEEPETEAGFLAVPSVARLVQRLDAS